MAIRRVGVCAVAAAALFGAAACGSHGSGARPVGAGAGASDPSRPTSSPAAQASSYDDQPPVRAVRAWNAAVGRSINAGDASLSRVRRLATAEGLAVSRKLAAGDIQRRTIWPGPEPFTPVEVSVQGRQARVTVCLLSRGWSVERKTGKPVNARRVVPAAYVLKNQGGWKFVNVYDATADCTGVSLPETKW